MCSMSESSLCRINEAKQSATPFRDKSSKLCRQVCWIFWAQDKIDSRTKGQRSVETAFTTTNKLAVCSFVCCFLPNCKAEKSSYNWWEFINASYERSYKKWWLVKQKVKNWMQSLCQQHSEKTHRGHIWWCSWIHSKSERVFILFDSSGWFHRYCRSAAAFGFYSLRQ